jgi:hypothetical protein
LLKIGSQAALWLWFVVVPQQSLNGHEFDTKAASAQFGTRWERLARQRLAGPCAEGS